MKLFEPASLGPLRLHNRMVMPPMATLFGNPDGTVSDRLLDYYHRRARGGVGLIIVENTAIHPAGVNYSGTLEIHDPRFEAGLSELAAALKEEGAAAAIQLFHPGRQIHPKYRGNYPVAPSPIPCPVMGGNPKELGRDEIRGLVQCFVDGAVRAKAVGFQAVEIHGAHGYLVDQFLSPWSNRRNDDYGGDARRRARFAREIILGIREKVGDSFPILLRISAEEKVEGGLTLAQTLETIPYLEQGLTALHVSAGCYPSMEWVVQPYLQPQGCLVELARAVRQVTALPLLTVGRINDARLANSILEAGTADFVSVGRALIADPDFPDKARAGKFAQIRPCLACNVCIEAVGIRQTRCAVNPQMGREHESFGPAPSPQKVLVVGGGPAGMEAALSAHGRGHRVWLAEADEALGGQMALAGVPDSKTEVRRLLDYYRSAIEESGVAVQLKKRLDPETIREFEPDQVILATGSAPVPPAFEVEPPAKALQAVDVLREQRRLPGQVVVVGGGPVGLDLAEYLAEAGAAVTVLEMNKRAGLGLEWNLGKMKLKALKDRGIKVLVNAKVVRVQAGRVVYLDGEAKEQTIAADYVVLAIGSKPRDQLEGALRSQGRQVTVIGDGKEPRGFAEAIAEGFEAAMKWGGSK